MYDQVIFDKDSKTIQWKKDSLFSKWYWKNWIFTCKDLTIRVFEGKTLRKVLKGESFMSLDLAVISQM